MNKNIMPLALSLLLIAPLAMAGLTPEQTQQLGTTLTPVGAEQAANAANTIPAWEKLSDNVIEQGQDGTLELYADESPLFTIEQANYKEHADKLTAGQIKLFETYPTFKMHIYPSHRNATWPEVVYNNTVKYAPTATLTEGGNGIQGTYNAIPFPIPQNGLEAVWNHIVRFRGIYEDRRYSNIITYKNGSSTITDAEIQKLYNFNRLDQTEEELNNILLYFKSTSLAPKKAGQATLVHETINQVERARDAWIYNPGFRRVRRSPNLSYDAPVSGADGLRTADETDMFNGATDRYDWDLKGKKEIYIPYNNEKLVREEGNPKDLVMPGHLNPDYARYELHRVWVVEGTLKEGQRHIYNKRTMYIDEDSWSIAAADMYDKRNGLWRVSMSYLRNAYEIPAVVSATDVFHDLQARRYMVYGLIYGQPKRPTYASNSPSRNAFTPNSLKQRSAR
ncbi:DUF1329 domain-containing protein [Kistimonas asteriae]|uniref:DUF1329 domain-containing protein n=1 Tax=Kistimonas asteriae TaxID=517724 RepID=UPI001BA81B92|nr:DUF1329 domain-containing protein [Kistimonas asteriae]